MNEEERTVLSRGLQQAAERMAQLVNENKKLKATNQILLQQLQIAKEQVETISELRKDKERLEWLVDNASVSMLRKDEDGGEWWVELDYSEPRDDIDEAMKEDNADA